MKQSIFSLNPPFLTSVLEATRWPFFKLLNLVWSEGNANVRSRKGSRNRERVRETRETKTERGLYARVLNLFIGGIAAAESFLFYPADDVGRAVFDCDVSRFGRTKKHHRLAIHKGHIRKVERHSLGFGTFSGKRALHFRQILFSQLAAQPHLERLFVFSARGDL